MDAGLPRQAIWTAVRGPLLVLLVSAGGHSAKAGSAAAWQVAGTDLIGGAVSATVTAEGRIYVVGIAENASLGMEEYDPKGRAWLPLPGSPCTCLEPAGIAETGGRIYAIGGSPDPLDFQASGSVPRPLGVVEVYDPRINRWSRGPSLRVPRYQPAAVAAPGGTIYAIGGDNTDAVEALAVPATRK